MIIAEEYTVVREKEKVVVEGTSLMFTSSLPL